VYDGTNLLVLAIVLRGRRKREGADEWVVKRGSRRTWGGCNRGRSDDHGEGRSLCWHSRLGMTPQYIANSETNKSSCTLDLERKKRRMLVHTQIELILDSICYWIWIFLRCLSLKIEYEEAASYWNCYSLLGIIWLHNLQVVHKPQKHSIFHLWWSILVRSLVDLVVVRAWGWSRCTLPALAKSQKVHRLCVPLVGGGFLPSCGQSVNVLPLVQFPPERLLCQLPCWPASSPSMKRAASELVEVAITRPSSSGGGAVAPTWRAPGAQAVRMGPLLPKQVSLANASSS
jgi:hypothetical protein